MLGYTVGYTVAITGLALGISQKLTNNTLFLRRLRLLLPRLLTCLFDGLQPACCHDAPPVHNTTWAAVISLNRFLGPEDDYVTTNSPVTKSQSHTQVRSCPFWQFFCGLPTRLETDPLVTLLLLELLQDWAAKWSRLSCLLKLMFKDLRFHNKFL